MSNFEEIKIVYENKWLIEMVYRVSDNIRDKVTEQVKFEKRCIEKLGKYLYEDIERIKNERYLRNMILKEASDAVNRQNKNEYYNTFSELSYVDESGEEIEFEPYDVLADIEGEILQKEMTTILANGSHKNYLILSCWSTGNTNGKLIARMLAHTFGGNTESHRRSITRFRTNCINKLANLVEAV